MDDFSKCCGPLSGYLNGLGWSLAYVGKAALCAMLVAAALSATWGFVLMSRQPGPGQPLAPWKARDVPTLAYAAALGALLLSGAADLALAAFGDHGLARVAASAAWNALAVAAIVGTGAILGRFALRVRDLARDGDRLGAYAVAAGTIVSTVAGAVPAMIGLTILGAFGSCRAAFFADISRYNAALAEAHRCPSGYCVSPEVPLTWAAWLTLIAILAVGFYVAAFFAMAPRIPTAIAPRTEGTPEAARESGTGMTLDDRAP